jgi:hypothetical protein
MRARPGGRIGANVYPTTGKATGLWWLGDVYLGKRFGNCRLRPPSCEWPQR